jgi:hypothetical protein
LISLLQKLVFSQATLQEIEMMKGNFKIILLLASRGAHFAFQSHHAVVICQIVCAFQNWHDYCPLLGKT